ncbi:hypothetical protein ACJMK2_029579 [Sinanodonta woodiana]|uniref:Uncharacterized protein n=1 Tax=Sinanodonta woodiana TaxID=1069815 RepID=A0ABD3XE86_SINWO
MWRDKQLINMTTPIVQDQWKAILTPNKTGVRSPFKTQALIRVYNPYELRQAEQDETQKLREDLMIPLKASTPIWKRRTNIKRKATSSSPSYDEQNTTHEKGNDVSLSDLLDEKEEKTQKKSDKCVPTENGNKSEVREEEIRTKPRRTR